MVENNNSVLWALTWLNAWWNWVIWVSTWTWHWVYWEINSSNWAHSAVYAKNLNNNWRDLKCGWSWDARIPSLYSYYLYLLDPASWTQSNIWSNWTNLYWVDKNWITHTIV